MDAFSTLEKMEKIRATFSSLKEGFGALPDQRNSTSRGLQNPRVPSTNITLHTGRRGESE